MAIKEFLRNLFRKEEKFDEHIGVIDLPFEKLQSKIVSELQTIEKEKDIVKKEIRENVLRFSSDLNEQIKILKNIDLSKRKEIEKIKLITLDNLKIYISHLEKLTDYLVNEANYKELEVKEYAEDINNTLTKFMHSSHSSFEKATILIGKELEQNKALIIEFFNLHRNLFSANKNIFEKEMQLSSLNNLLENYNSVNSAISDNEIEFVTISEKMNNSLKEKQNKEKELSLLINSSLYKEILVDKNNLQEEKNILNSEITSLKEQIDLKYLLKLFHNDDKKSKIIKSYKENFLSGLSSDAELILGVIIEQVRPEMKIQEKLKKIKEKNSSLQNKSLSSIEKDKINIERKLSNLLVESKSLENELEKSRKKQDKIKEKLSFTKSEIKISAAKLNWNIPD
ncbi:hypothetical protein HYW75_05055 [Candidatus Pacearchaeota archaeon]|nr:hypothetical protein [Candidatus Pacearchaeota archaeon]